MRRASCEATCAHQEYFEFETVVVDTGIGIEENRQKMLFEPFMELKMKQSFENVKDYNIGMGLTCSQAIARKMGGDITIKQSNRGLTEFAFKVPVLIGDH